MGHPNHLLDEIQLQFGLHRQEPGLGRCSRQRHASKRIVRLGGPHLLFAARNPDTESSPNVRLPGDPQAAARWDVLVARHAGQRAPDPDGGLERCLGLLDQGLGPLHPGRRGLNPGIVLHGLIHQTGETVIVKILDPAIVHRSRVRGLSPCKCLPLGDLLRRNGLGGSLVVRHDLSGARGQKNSCHEADNGPFQHTAHFHHTFPRNRVSRFPFAGNRRPCIFVRDCF